MQWITNQSFPGQVFDGFLPGATAGQPVMQGSHVGEDANTLGTGLMENTAPEDHLAVSSEPWLAEEEVAALCLHLFASLSDADIAWKLTLDIHGGYCRSEEDIVMKTRRDATKERLNEKYQ